MRRWNDGMQTEIKDIKENLKTIKEELERLWKIGIYTHESQQKIHSTLRLIGENADIIIGNIRTSKLSNEDK